MTGVSNLRYTYNLKLFKGSEYHVRNKSKVQLHTKQLKKKTVPALRSTNRSSTSTAVSARSSLAAAFALFSFRFVLFFFLLRNEAFRTKQTKRTNKHNSMEQSEPLTSSRFCKRLSRVLPCLLHQQLLSIS